MAESLVHILIVDDSPEDRFAYRRLLENGDRQDHKYVFEECEEGQQCLNLIREKRPDCVLLDYQLPDMDGLEILQQLKDEKLLDRVAVVMLTGQGDQTTAVEAMKLGARDYLVKNIVSTGALERAVRSAIATK